MKRFISILYLVFFSFVVTLAQKECFYPVSQIPDSLRKNAYSVVRYESNDFEYINSENGVLKVTRAVTILNDKGSDAANFSDGVGKFWKLKKFSGKILDQTGKVIKKIKMSDLRTSSISTELATDESISYYECSQPVYPYTVVYEYEEDWVNGMMDFPSFSPMQDFQQSVQQAVYHLTMPMNVKFQAFARNMPQTADSTMEKNHSIYTWMLNGLPAIDEEDLMPSFYTLAPRLQLKPVMFSFDKSTGSLASWQDVGQWLWMLSAKQDELPPDAVQKIQEITSGARSEKEKVKRLYHYLQSSTRYVSIQLGIGSYQPMPAATVYKTGFSDCKGLSNYMMAMLKVIGIPSFYTIINTDRAHLITSFASPRQANHAILIVPLGKDTIPLECTSSVVPFGYIHHEIAGHDALLVTSAGGRLYHLPSYPDSASYVRTAMYINLSNSGELQAKIHSVYTLSHYEEMLPFEKIANNDDRIKIIAADYHLPSLKISNIALVDHHDSLPSLELTYSLSSDTYATLSGSHMFVSVNPRKNLYPFFSSKFRKYPIVIQNGNMESDTLIITIPNDLTIEKVPADISLQKSFGKFFSHISIHDKTLKIVQTIAIPAEELPAKGKDDFKSFLDTVNQAYQDQIVLRKL
ncbi:DUF3857 domain-containing protein [Microbacter margulisiae]|uniref:DUF3857 domain-containing protein n=1 Tax=Microbacter margulisiae TaxID=1350067 RepID=A0A7W5DQ94_9PORP|nr:DUF3857 domain-containing protein [Microbacter margulisiae]MBB3187062.1 hypothetical protein [Microbacter margulisiae]